MESRTNKQTRLITVDNDRVKYFIEDVREVIDQAIRGLSRAVDSNVVGFQQGGLRPSHGRALYMDMCWRLCRGTHIPLTRLTNACRLEKER